MKGEWGWFWIVLLIAILAGMFSGCSSKPIIETKLVDRPVPVYCKVDLPEECKDSYAVDKVSINDTPVMINRAFREEIEERWRCELKLRAALNGCNSTK